MKGGERIGVKAVSTVIAAVIVLTVFIGLASAIYAGLFQLGNESSDLVKREAERAMEAFFQIYWLNDTHVVLFNNHTSVAITLRFWVTTDPAIGVYSVDELDPSKYSVPPGSMRIVKNFKNREELKPVNRVVSERGMVFEVGSAPITAADLHSLIYFTPTEKIVRPGFNGRLTTFVITTGVGFSGGDVTLTCDNIVRIDPPPQTILPCTAWGISLEPASTINVPAGGAGAIGVNAIIPTTTLGFYVVKLKLQTASFTREYAVRVIVSDFSASISPATLTLQRLDCALPVTLTITTTLSYTGHINIRVPSPRELNAWSSPNPVHPPASTLALIFVERVWTRPPTKTVTTTLTATLNDGLGAIRTAQFVVVHVDDVEIGRNC
jgi:hypothetical protein